MQALTAEQQRDIVQAHQQGTEQRTVREDDDAQIAAMFNMLGRWPLAAWLAWALSGWAWTNLVHIWSISAGFCVL